METMKEIFGEVIYSYTRKQSIEDGFQVDVTEKAKEAGFKFPVYLTRTVWDEYVEVPEKLKGMQDEIGRLWDILTMLKYAAQKGGEQINFVVKVRTAAGYRNITLTATCGANDINDPQPAITVMLPGED